LTPRDLYVDLLGRAVRGDLDALRHRNDPSRGRYDTEVGWSERVPEWGYTMIGEQRLENLRACVDTVLTEDVRGDLIETGVWRGGATILMRGMLAAYGDGSRSVYVADSFQGVPPPSRDEDAWSELHTWPELAVTADDVRANFARFGLLDERVRFVEGWFRDTLPALASHTWSVVRLDGDLYESTTDGLENLYPALSPGGFLIVDDYGAYEACRDAVHDYRAKHDVTEEIVTVDWTGAYWRKSG
jgi:O-methyltransferase